MPDSSEVDAALVSLLLADATLMALTPDGVFMDEAGPSIAPGGGASKRFVIVSLIVEDDEPIFEGRASEDALYLVEARGLSTTAVPLPPTVMKQAAARIDALLDPQPPAARATLTIPGYGLLVMRRKSRVRLIEVDEVDSSIRWFRRGGRYQVMVAPILT